MQELTILTRTTPQYKEDIDDTDPEFDTDDFAFISTQPTNILDDKSLADAPRR